MINNILRGLPHVHDPILFYCEDHVVIESIPSEATIQRAIDLGIGWINYNTHVHEENLLNIPGFVERPGKEERLSTVNTPKLWLEMPDGDFLFKVQKIQDEYNLCFPAVITEKYLFKNMLFHGMENYSGIGIEIGFTRAWQDLDLWYGRNTAILTKPGTARMLPLESFGALHQRACMRFRNNDPSMLHDSVVPHTVMPKDKGKRRSFF
jgi:hypothetical protein